MTSKHCCLGSSPSSDGVGTANGTPETRLTPFSSAKSTNDKMASPFDQFNVNAASNAIAEASISHHGVNLTDKDPFISIGTRTSCEQSVLSPTASAFQPFSVRISQAVDHTSTGFEKESQLVALQGMSLRAPASAAASKTEPLSPMNSSNSIIAQSGSFSTDLGYVTRALKVAGIYQPVEEFLLQAGVQKVCEQINGSLKFFHTGENILIRLSDIIDAINIYNSLKVNHPEWSVDFITPAAFTEKVVPNGLFASAHEGQINLFASFSPSGGFDRAKLELIILDLLGIDGLVYAYQKQLATEAGTIRLIAEYSDINSAARAVERLDGTSIRGINISIAFHRPDLAASPRYRGQPITPTRAGLNRDELAQAMNKMAVSSPGVMNVTTMPHGYTSILSTTGRSFVPTPVSIAPGIANIPATYGCQFPPSISGLLSFTPPASQHNQVYQSPHFGIASPGQHGFITQMGEWDGVRRHAQGANRLLSLPRNNSKRINSTQGGNRPSYANSSVGQHNVVDVDRIRAGLDVRTTIMLRNIPNKIDQALLKSIVDQTSRGLYDFMYLRIDFANNCNVGYAFINFEDPYHIIGFVSARAGQRWNRYSSDKIAEVSYATIQGKDCLVQKFRNSSVMLEHPTFRPKIFFTGNDPRAGEEEAFPPPDNASKMRRSVENAEHVGLFAPRAGQHYRDEQRRRKSRYDRGTRLAALEEYDFEEYYSVDRGYQGPFTV